ncbi:THAP-type domain-containing protein [Aphis craccivora]|uniref:THAP-type domain-containing protein n=1 Tax=Aphis craccivora TaxID=307492 RepID=A0A6G0VRL1_APHCR|nr:THAP-type domain-containing protein [Aphis craccivora]
MFFSAIRSHGGFCDYPTAGKFTAYKILLIHNEIVTSSQENLHISRHD